MKNLDKWYFLGMNAQKLLHKKGKITIDELIKELNDKAYDSDEMFDDSDKDKIIKNIDKDTSYFADYKFYGDVLKRIEFKPFTCVFKTSGKIIVENDLRSYFENEADNFNVNCTQGIIDTMQYYADQGMLHGFVGNSCPTLYISKKHGEIIIGCDYDYNTDEPKLPDDSYKSLASVCTDLWWYSIVDLETFQRNNPDVDVSNFKIVDVPAGVWELSHKYGISSTGYHEDLPYATIKTNMRERKLDRLVN